MSAPPYSFRPMAFKSWAGQTVAIGHGTMTAAASAWSVSCVLLLGPVAVVLAYTTWLTWPSQRPFVEQILPVTLGASLLALGLLMLIQCFILAAAGLIFAGPRNRIGDRVRMLARSRTARWCAVSTALTVALMIPTRFPFGPSRLLVLAALSIGLIWAMLAGARGFAAVYRTNRKAPFFSGMTEAEKQIADNALPELRKPSFPPLNDVESAEEARQYARRARTIAGTHIWGGAAILVIFSAFIVTAFSAVWESADPLAWAPSYLVLGALALGFWIQRRSRSYERLHDAFEARAHELDEEMKRPSLVEKFAARLGLRRLR